MQHGSTPLILGFTNMFMYMGLHEMLHQPAMMDLREALAVAHESHPVWPCLANPYQRRPSPPGVPGVAAHLLSGLSSSQAVSQLLQLPLPACQLLLTACHLAVEGNLLLLVAAEG